MKNFKTLFIFLSVFYCTVCVSAQTPKFVVSAEFAITGNELFNHFMKAPDVKYGYGISNAATIQYNFSKHFSIKSGIAFDTKRMHEILPLDFSCPYNIFCVFNYEKYGYTHQLNYIKTPLLIQTSFGKRFQFFIDAGVYFSGLFASSYAADYYAVSESSNLKVQNTYKPYDFGVIWGVGIKIPIGKNFSIPFELRANRSLVDQMSDIYPHTSGFKIHTRDIIIGLSYSFNGLKK